MSAYQKTPQQIPRVSKHSKQSLPESEITNSPPPNTANSHCTSRGTRNLIVHTQDTTDFNRHTQTQRTSLVTQTPQTPWSLHSTQHPHRPASTMSPRCCHNHLLITTPRPDELQMIQTRPVTCNSTPIARREAPPYLHGPASSVLTLFPLTSDTGGK